MNQLIKSLSAIDKQAHFGWGAMICAVFTIICLLQDIDGPLSWRHLLYCIIGTVVAVVFMLIKEFVIDENTDPLDLVSTALGCIPVWLAVALGILLNILMHP